MGKHLETALCGETYNPTPKMEASWSSKLGFIFNQGGQVASGDRTNGGMLEGIKRFGDFLKVAQWTSDGMVLNKDYLILLFLNNCKSCETGACPRITSKDIKKQSLLLWDILINHFLLNSEDFDLVINL